MITYAHCAKAALLLLAAINLTSCEDEQIPAFVAVDHYTLNTVAGQGTSRHAITDCWVYVDEQIIGAFQMPFEIPVLAEGEHTIRIRPGIRVNGLESQRSISPFFTDKVITTQFHPDSTITFSPTTEYRVETDFVWLEDFTQAGFSLEASDISITAPLRQNIPENVIEGHYMRMHIPAGDTGIAECRSTGFFDLEKEGKTVFLEFDYKCNTPLRVGLMIYEPTTLRQIPILVLNPTTEWKHIYVSLTENVSFYTNAFGQRVFFGFIGLGDQTEPLEALIDNIKLMQE